MLKKVSGRHVKKPDTFCPVKTYILRGSSGHVRGPEGPVKGPGRQRPFSLQERISTCDRSLHVSGPRSSWWWNFESCGKKVANHTKLRFLGGLYVLQGTGDRKPLIISSGPLTVHEICGGAASASSSPGLKKREGVPDTSKGSKGMPRIEAL